MIKFLKTAPDKSKIVGIGLSEENVKRLQNDMPISFNLRELGLDDCQILIFTGKDEDQMKMQVKQIFGEIKEERRYK